MDWIQGDKFQAIADFTYAPQDKAMCDYAMFPNTLDVSKIKKGDIIYTQGFTHYKQQLLNIIRDLDDIIILSHNCDNDINDSFDIPKNVMRWYGQNINTHNPVVEALPTGLENDRRDFGVMKKEKMLANLQGERKLRNLLYLDFNIEMNPSEREEPYRLFKDKTWVTAIRDKCIPFDGYIDNVYNHKFALCPAGNGLTTHRPWEAMYMGTIPIKKRHVSNRDFRDYPILFVDEWSEISEDFLNREYDRIKSMPFYQEMLTFAYWKNKLLMRKHFDGMPGYHHTYTRFYRDMARRIPDGGSFAEVGCYRGKSLFYFLMEIANAGKTINATAIDSFIGTETEDTHSDVKNGFISNMKPFEGKYGIIEGDSALSAKQFPDKSLDFVFIDADHRYTSVKKDITAWLPKVKSGGIISGHDYGSRCCDVIRAVGEVFGNRVDLSYKDEVCWLVNI